MAQMNEGAIATMNEDDENDEENSSLEEWTLLDKASNDSIKTISSTQKTGRIRPKSYADAEFAREAIQVLKPLSSSMETSNMNNSDKNKNECSAGRADDSNGVPVVSEDDYKIDESQIRNISNVAHPVNNVLSPTRTFTCIIVACSLAAAIGFGIGHTIGKRETQVSGNKVNLGFAETMECIQNSDQLSKKIVEPDVNIDPPAVWRKLEDISEPISHDGQFVNIDDNYNLRNAGSLRVTLEKVRFSLDILCSVIDNTNDSSQSNEYIPICADPSSIMNLIELKEIMQSAMMDIRFIEDRSNKWFIEHMESKLKNISVSLVNDLSMTIKKSITKIDRKFNKIRHKLDQRLCLIRNTIGDDERIKKILNKYNVLGENCPTEKSVHKVEVMSDMGQGLEKKQKNIEKYIHPVGPEVKVGLNNENSNVKVKDESGRKKEKVRKNERGKSYKSRRDYKSRKHFSKGDFTSERETMELPKYIMKTVQKPIVAPPNIISSHHDKSDTEEFCHSNLCSKQRINDRKNGRDSKNDNWQFKRSDGRFNWREGIKVVDDDDESSWDDKRAKARRSAREKY